MIKGIGFIAALLMACSTHAEVLTGQVVGIADGDTITILDSSRQQHKIRLAGIDAPDMQVPSKKS